MKTLIILTALLLAASAQAQQVWRCGPDGRSYADRPCNDGRTVAVADARDAADVQSAKALADRDRRLAAALRQERLKREAQPVARAQDLSPRRDLIAPVKVASQAPPLPRRHSKSKRRQAADADIWRAVAPASR